MPVLLSVRNLRKVFKKDNLEISALKEVSFDVMLKDTFGIIGFSGAGKSTLLKCLCSLEEPSDGEIEAFGETLSFASKKNLLSYRRQIGMVFQHFQLFSSKTVFENVAYPLQILGIHSNEIKERVEKILSLVGLKHKSSAYPAQLSGGEKQRVGIARALVHNPKILFCDEPTSALDTKNKREILTLLKVLQKELNLTVILIAHEMNIIKNFCNKIAVIDEGEIVELGSLAEVFFNPTHPTTKKLVDQTIHEIPEHLKNRSNFIYQLVFKGENAKEPIISKMIRNHAIEVNILMGWIDSFENITIGNLLIEIFGSSEAIEKSLSYLEEQHVKVEKMHK